MSNKNLIPHIIYNNMYISESKSRDLYRSMCDQVKESRSTKSGSKIKFESEKEFRYWLYNIQNSYRELSVPNKFFSVIIDAKILGDGVFSEDTTIFICPYIHHMLFGYQLSSLKVKNDLPLGITIFNKNKEHNSYGVAIGLLGYGSLYFYTSKNKSDIPLLFHMYKIVKEYSIRKSADIYKELEVIDDRVYKKLINWKVFDSRLIVMDTSKYLLSEANRILADKGVFKKIDEILIRYSKPKIVDWVSKTIPIESVFEIKSDTPYRAYLLENVPTSNFVRKYWGMVKRVKEHPAYRGITIKWKNTSEFLDWCYHEQNGYLEKKPEFSSEKYPGYQLDKDLFFNGSYSPESCVFIPAILNSAIQKNRPSRGGLPYGVFSKKNSKNETVYYSVVSVMGERYFTTPPTSSEKVSYAYYKLIKEYYIRKLAKEFYDRNLLIKKVYDKLQSYSIKSDIESYEPTDSELSMAKNSLLSNGTFDKFDKVFNDTCINKITSFENTIIKFNIKY